MQQKQRFFIYDRKEMGVLLLLGVMVAIFAFTLGVHLGKRVGPKGELNPVADEAHPISTVPDKTPNHQELTEQAKGAQQAADDSLNQALHDEVARTGIKLDTPRQVQLPDKPHSEGGGATTITIPPLPEETATATATAKPTPKPVPPEVAAFQRAAPAGRFTLQIGSYPTLDEAKDQADSLEALGLKPYMRPAVVRGSRWYRIYVGGFSTQEAADKMGARYVSQHLIEAYVVSKRVD